MWYLREVIFNCCFMGTEKFHNVSQDLNKDISTCIIFLLCFRTYCKETVLFVAIDLCIPLINVMRIVGKKKSGKNGNHFDPAHQSVSY